MKSRIVFSFLILALATLTAACGEKSPAPASTASPENMAAFFAIVKAGGLAEVEAVMAKGVDINARNADNETPLLIAAGSNKNANVIASLVAAGADVNARGPNHGTALMYAASSNPNPDVILELLKAGADAKLKDDSGARAIEYYGDVKSDAYKKLEAASK